MLILVLTNCTLKNVEKHHGFHYLEKKSNKLLINATNKNDIIEILGPPSTKGSFDKDVWIYLELVEKKQSIFKLGKNIIDVNIEDSNVGQSGNIIITNPSSVGSLAFTELGSKFKTPSGATINFDLTADKIAIISYIVLTTDSILVNYIGDFS